MNVFPINSDNNNDAYFNYSQSSEPISDDFKSKESHNDIGIINENESNRISTRRESMIGARRQSHSSRNKSDRKHSKVMEVDPAEPQASFEVKGNISKYFRVELCRYNQVIYIKASTLLKKFKYDAQKAMQKVTPDEVQTVNSDNLSEDTDLTTQPSLNDKEPLKDKKIIPVPKGTFKVAYRSLKEKKLTFELALSSLKYDSIFEKILDETGFYIQFPDYREEDMLVLIILNDYIKRKFQLRTIPEEEKTSPNPIADEIEQAIYSLRTKLNAAVMRCRVKNGVRSLNQLLPDHFRIGEEFAEHMLVYMWYNANLATSEDMLKYLYDRGFKRVSAAKTLDQNEFYQDRHCSDLYVFHHDDRDCLEESELVTRLKFSVVQDKSTSLAIHCFIANIVQGEEIAIINPTTLLTAIHIEGLLKNKFGSVVPLAPIRVFRIPKDDDDPKILNKMGSTSIKIHTEDILTLDPTNEKYRSIKHAIFQAKCTRSAVVSPIDFLDTEQDDISLLKDYALRATLDGAKPVKISDSIVRNSMILRQCFRFSCMRSVTYLTHSIYDEENEILINKAVDLINKTMMKDTMEPNGKYDMFNNIPPNLPMLVDDLTENGILCDKNVKYPPSAETNGFFIALYAKESRFNLPDDQEGPAQEEKTKKKKKKQG